jgi:histidyl-tRNA synthetase
MQFDADTVGSSSPAADAEMCMMAADTMEALGIPRGSYVVKVNNRKILDGVMESIGLGGEENAGRRITVLRAIDKLDRLGTEGVKALLGPGRKDESGDFTRGAQLTPTEIHQIMRYVFASRISMSTFDHADWNRPLGDMLIQQGRLFVDNYEIIETLKEVVGDGPLGLAGLDELRQIVQLAEAAGFGSGRLVVDPSVVRGLEYYTGPVCEAELTFHITNDEGRPVRFGSVGGGGRYDGLISRFRGEPVPATGFSIGVSRLQAALTALGQLNGAQQTGPVVVTVFDKDRIADYQHMVQRLRAANIRAELYLGNPKNFGNQLKYADRRGAPCVIIQGGDEKARAEVQIKDLIEGAKAAAAIASNLEWRESRPAQFAVPEEKLVDAVREVLARHGIAG